MNMIRARLANITALALVFACYAASLAITGSDSAIKSASLSERGTGSFTISANFDGQKWTVPITIQNKVFTQWLDTGSPWLYAPSVLSSACLRSTN